MNSKQMVKAIAQLTQAGWRKSHSVMASDNRLAYGVCFVKDGVKFYLNKDTYIDTMTGEEMAIACKPLFN